MDYKKSYDLYLKKVEEKSIKKITLPSGKEKTTGVRMLRPYSYAEFLQVYPVIKEYTGGQNVLREIVNQTRVTSTVQAKAVWAIQSRLKETRRSDNESGEDESPKALTRGEINRLSSDQVREYFADEYKRFKSTVETKEITDSADVNSAWKQWKVIRGISG